MTNKAIAWIAALLSCADGLLTIGIGYEDNPLLRELFELEPLWMLIFKGCLIPVFVWLANPYEGFKYVDPVRRERGERLAREGLILATGWYAAIVVVELNFLISHFSLYFPRALS